MNTPTAEAPKDPIGFLDLYLVKKAPFQIPDFRFQISEFSHSPSAAGP